MCSQMNAVAKNVLKQCEKKVLFEWMIVILFACTSLYNLGSKNQNKPAMNQNPLTSQKKINKVDSR